MKLLEALRNSTGHLAAGFENSRLFTHAGEKGEFRERIIEDFLRPFLPTCYGIGSGQVFSSDGSDSKQVDIVLYDELFSNVLFRDASTSLFPCESVYGTIEVKSNLTTDDLKAGIANIASVKRLPRASSDMLDVLPNRRIELKGDISFSQTNISNPYLGVVFAYDGLSPNTAFEVLRSHLSSGEYPLEELPNFVFLYKHGVTIFRVSLDGPTAVVGRPGQPFNAYGLLNSGNDTLPLFFLTLNAILNSMRLKAPDVNRYWSDVFYGLVNSHPGKNSTRSSGPSPNR